MATSCVNYRTYRLLWLHPEMFTMGESDELCRTIGSVKM